MSDHDNGTIFNKNEEVNQNPDQTNDQDTADTAADQGGDNQKVGSGFEDLLSNITDPNGRPKYSSVEDALKALQHSQSHIQTLEADNGELRGKVEQALERMTEYEKRSKTMEEIIQEVKAGQHNESEKPSEAPSVDPEFIESTVEGILTKRQQAELAGRNVNTVIEAFKEKYGEEKAEEVFYSRAEELGVGRDFINNLAAQSPKAVFSLYGIESKPKQTDAFSKSSVNTDRMEPNKQQPSVKVKFGATTDDMTAAWRAAGQSLNNE